MTYPNDPYSQGPGTPGGYPPPFYPQPRKTNGLAIASMVTSIVGLLMCWGLPGIAGAIMGHKARKQVRQQNEEGEGFATAGIIVGWIGFGIFILSMLFLVGLIIFGVIASETTSSTTDFD